MEETSLNQSGPPQTPVLAGGSAQAAGAQPIKPLQPGSPAQNTGQAQASEVALNSIDLNAELAAATKALEELMAQPEFIQLSKEGEASRIQAEEAEFSNQAQLIQWLSVATLKQILDYIKDMPDDYLDEHPDLMENLLSAIRIKRNNGLESYIDTNASLVLSEPQLIEMISYLPQYNAESVLANYQKRYPALQGKVLKPGSSEWATTFLKLWDNYFYFASGEKLLELEVYMRSLIKAAYSPEVIEYLHTQVGQLEDELVQEITLHNYEYFVLSEGLQKRLQEFFARFPFIPQQLVEGLANGSSMEWTVDQLDILKRLLDILYIAQTEGKTLESNEKLTFVLWSDLRLEEELRAMRGYHRAWQQGQEEQESQNMKLYERLAQMINLSNIQDGSCQEFLKQYMSQLNPEQKKLFLQDLSYFLINLPDIEAILEPLDVEFVIEKIKKEPLAQNKIDFVNSQVNEFDPTAWPLAQKVMLMLTNIF